MSKPLNFNHAGGPPSSITSQILTKDNLSKLSGKSNYIESLHRELEDEKRAR